MPVAIWLLVWGIYAMPEVCWLLCTDLSNPGLRNEVNNIDKSVASLISVSDSFLKDFNLQTTVLHLYQKSELKFSSIDEAVFLS